MITWASSRFSGWDRGAAGDDTHGHVDDITRFVGPTTIVTAVEPNAADDNHAPLAENLARLKASRTLMASSGRLSNCRCRAGCLSRAAAAGQLCQLLYRQWTGAGADVS
jgi:agmatine/peptidylarginine deiminase